MRLSILLIILASCAGIAAFVHHSQRPIVRKLLLTVSVETPQGLVTGQSTVFVGYKKVLWSAGGNTSNEVVNGEAVAIFLPSKPTLFALIGDNENGVAFNSIIGEAIGGSVASDSNAKIAPTQLPRRRQGGMSGWPRFVRFEDLDDARSIQWVDPDHMVDAYGEGYAIRSVSVKSTKLGLSADVRKLLPSFMAPEYLQFLRSLPPGDPRVVLTNDFKRSDPI